MERNKEGDGFARLRWGETKEGDAVGGARLTIEIGAEFLIGIRKGGTVIGDKIAVDSGVFNPDLLTTNYGKEIGEQWEKHRLRDRLDAVSPTNTPKRVELTIRRPFSGRRIRPWRSA